MKFNSIGSCGPAKVLSQPAVTRAAGGGQRRGGFTLTEVMIGLALITVVIIGSFSAIYFNTQASYKLADRTAIVALVRAKLEAVRAATYNPPDSNFKSTLVYLTNRHSIALNKAGTEYLLSGTILTKIEEAKSGTNMVGHLVIATGTFTNAGKPITVQMQTVVNKYSGGQQ